MGWSRDKKALFVKWDGDVIRVNPEDWESLPREELQR